VCEIAVISVQQYVIRHTPFIGHLLTHTCIDKSRDINTESICNFISLYFCQSPSLSPISLIWYQWYQMPMEYLLPRALALVAASDNYSHRHRYRYHWSQMPVRFSYQARSGSSVQQSQSPLITDIRRLGVSVTTVIFKYQWKISVTWFWSHH
jgi:hypothetical protein